MRAEGSKRLTTVCNQQGDAIAAGLEIAATNIPNCGFKAAMDVSAKPGATATIRSRREADLIPTPHSGPLLVPGGEGELFMLWDDYPG